MDKYCKNIKYLIEKYKKMGQSKSQNSLKRYLCEKMIINGYNTEEFLNFIEVDDVDEHAILKKEIKGFFSKNDINEENIAKITKKLLSKGFNYGIIKQVIRECEANETY
jgi:SOS response regulatory protein OraA/RecX